MPEGRKMTRYREVTDLDRQEPCGECRGPFEFWGISPEFRLFRCLTCRVVRYFGRGESPAALAGIAAEAGAPRAARKRRAA